MEDGRSRLKYSPTKDMIAYGLTKALGRERHRRLAGMMGTGVFEDYVITRDRGNEGEYDVAEV